MRERSRAALPRMLLLAGLLLGACNMPVGPMREFGKADAGGQVLKPGIWTVLSCDAVRPTAGPCPVGKERIMVSAAAIEGTENVRNRKPEPVKLVYALVAGTPLLMQVRMVKPPREQEEDPFFVFFAWEALARDPDGQATQVRVWAISCGPRTQHSNSGFMDEDPDAVDVRPGLTMHDGECTGALDAVRNAATESRKDGGTVYGWQRAQ